jgi:hypothetical protein
VEQAEIKKSKIEIVKNDLLNDFMVSRKILIQIKKPPTGGFQKAELLNLLERM